MLQENMSEKDMHLVSSFVAQSESIFADFERAFKKSIGKNPQILAEYSLSIRLGNRGIVVQSDTFNGVAMNLCDQLSLMANSIEKATESEEDKIDGCYFSTILKLIPDEPTEQ